MTETLKATNSLMGERKKREINKAVEALFTLKEQMNKQIDLIALITETDSWEESHHVRQCLEHCNKTVEAMKKRIVDIERAITQPDYYKNL